MRGRDYDKSRTKRTRQITAAISYLNRMSELFPERSGIFLPAVDFLKGPEAQGLRRSYAPPYRTWQSMQERCFNPNHMHFHNYGGRGITVCERWRTYDNFLEDMGVPDPGHSIDRIDMDGNYEPGNCRWANQTEQARNRRNNNRVELDGQTKTATEWCREFGIDLGTVRSRVAKGMSWKDAFATPVRKSRRAA